MPTSCKALAIALSIAVMLPLVGCSSGPKMVQTWVDPGYQGLVFDSFIIVGIGKEQGTIRLFEDTFAATLRGRKLAAVASYTLRDGTEKLSEEEVEQIINQTGANGILVTRLISHDQKVNYQPGYTTMAPMYYDYWGYYNYAWGVAYSPGYAYSYDVVRLETNLYTADVDFKLIWSGVSETVDFTSVKQEIPRLADKILKELDREGLI
jgi:hypothetical protein